MMSVTFFIPIMLAHAWVSACLHAHHGCMHTCIHVTPLREVADGGREGGGPEKETEREREKRDAARVYRAGITPKARIGGSSEV